MYRDHPKKEGELLHSFFASVINCILLHGQFITVTIHNKSEHVKFIAILTHIKISYINNALPTSFGEFEFYIETKAL